jgi:hypothetical protein
MTDKPKKLSDTARALLTVAVKRDDHLVALPRLPVAAARQVVRSMLNASLVEEVPAPIEDATFAWRTGEDGGVMMLRATASGLDQIADPEAAAAPETAHEPAADANGSGTVTEMASTSGASLTNVTRPAVADPCQAPRMAPTIDGRTARLGDLREAAQALLDAWESDGDPEGLNGAVAALRATLAESAAAPPTIERSRSRSDTKQSKVLAMLARDEGASGPQIAKAMGWAPHTVRGFLAGLAKRGIKVEVLERVRQVGFNKQGGKGSYSIYHIVGMAKSRVTSSAGY